MAKQYDEKKTIIQADQSIPRDKLDNLKTYTYGVYFILHNTLNNLVELDKFGVVVPSLAEKFRVSADGLVYYFKLRKGLKFSNGRSLTTEDVNYSIKRHILAKGHYHIALRNNIKGAKNFVKPSDNISGLVLINEQEIKIELLKPIPKFLMYLSYINLAIVPKESTKINTTEIDFIHPASGPYQIVSHSENSVVLKVVKEHHLYNKDMPEKVIFKRMKEEDGLKAMENREIDLINPRTSTIKSLKAFKKSKFQFFPAVQLVHLLYVDYKSNLFNDFPKLAGYINRFINRENLIDNQNKEFIEPAYQLIPYGFMGHDPKFTKTSITREELLNYTKGKRLKVKLKIFPGISKEIKELVSNLKAQLEDVNIELEILQGSSGDTKEIKNKRDWNFLMIAHGIDYQFPEEFFESMLPHDNFMRMDIDNQAYRLLPEIDHLKTIEERSDFIKKMNTIFYNEGIVIPIAFTKGYWIASKNIEFGEIPPLYGVFPFYVISFKK